MNRPALQRLLADVAAGRVQIVVVYKVDRLTRSLADFAKLVEQFDAHGVSFVSVTQQFNTTSSMGRLTLNVLLSFAQFEREVTGERIRDKIAASKRKGLWMGGIAPIGYRPHERSLAIEEVQAERVRAIYRLYLELGCVSRLKREIDARAWRTPPRATQREGATGDRPFSRGHLYRILSNPVYRGQIVHKGQVFEGHHPAIVDQAVWQAVQDGLASNRQGQRVRRGAKDASLLAGLVFGSSGDRLTPSHAAKGQKRYRYYVGKGGEETLRIPAPELERGVVGCLARFLQDEGRVIDALTGTGDATAVQGALRQAKEAAGELQQVKPRIETVQRLVERIAVSLDQLRITLKAGGLPGMVQTTIEAPVQLKRCGMAMRLIVGNGSAPRARQADGKLIGLIAKAQGWFALLASGRCSTVAEVAKQAQISPSYVTRVIYLAFLAPDIVEAIATGEGPLELSADRLTRMGPLPMDWEEQRALLGMG
ncbi:MULTISPECIES: recombinase family protein [unclassified Methylibium]|uniref:recombinase family protein n=1 Tax=unclassified Methylibium TaxID=2633235 RepID=UPI0003F3E930|nr:MULTISPECIES: recombinase family protein [unclassified Methylibium]EWS54645.1 DNA-invertase hin [Methylibium sp. T29]EWS61724.1 DNA-invertase hin [Methylibium sp. T29-B]